MHVLIACESQSSTALMRDAVRLGRELQARHRLTYAMADLAAFAECEHTGERATIPAPVLRESPELIMKHRAAEGFDDVLALAGFANRIQLNALAASWRQQIELVRPDVIVGFHAPVLWLVGAALRPTFAIGCGSFLPPRLGDVYPRVSAITAPLAAEHAMVANANEVLKKLGAAPISAITGITERCIELLYGAQAFDPYLQLRRAPSLGLLGPVEPQARIPAEPRLAVFLDMNCPNIEAIVLGLVGADGISSDVVLRGATAGITRFLQQQPQITMHQDWAAVASSLDRISGIVHHGDHDFAQLALGSGIPDLRLPWTSDQKRLCENSNWMGLSNTFPPSAVLSDNAEMFQRFVKNASLVVQARHHARQFEASNLADALPQIASCIERSSPPQAANVAAS